MQITVLFFAIIRQKAQTDRIVLNLPEGSTIQTASQLLVERFPALASYLQKVAWALNQEYADPSAVLSDGDELAVIPAVSGGC